jgi:hypothetical protein
MPERHPVLPDINIDDPLAFGGGEVIEHRHAGCCALRAGGESALVG